jgi:hypothetical protein
MKVAYKIIGNASRSIVLKTFIFFFALSFLTIFPSRAQDDSTAAAPDSAATTVAGSDDGSPSIANLTKNLSESAEELERIRKEEILSYVYMGLGFSVVIGIAWFTTVLAKKRKKKEDEIRALRMHHTKHHHHHGKAHPKR